MANVWKHINNGQSHKTIEWVKLIDYEYSQKDGQSMISIQFRKKCYENEVWKVKDLRSRFLIWKDMKMFAHYLFTSFKSQQVKWGFETKRMWMKECKTS